MLNFLKEIIKKTISPNPYHNSYLHKLRLKIPIVFLNSKTTLATWPVFEKAKGFFLYFSTNSYISVVVRPKFSKNFNINPFQKNSSDAAILIQGPIKDNIKFLNETIKIYKKNFPKTIIVLSMWDYEEKFLNVYLKNQIDKVIVNKRSDVKHEAIGNLNLQTWSTFNGLKYITKCKKKYTIKQRADGRFYNPNTLNFLKYLSKSFPTKNKKISRILVSNIGTMKYRFFCLSDVLVYGETKNLLKYFTNESYNKSINKMYSKINLKFPIIKGVPLVVETFLCIRYLKNIGMKIKLDQSSWWKSLKKYFLIFDISNIDFYHNKHGQYFEERQIKTYSNIDHEVINFSDWIYLYYNNKPIWPKNHFEKFAIKNNIWTRLKRKSEK